jgi:spore coat protein A, manganese oxidase
MREALVKVHRDLPPTRMWTMGGSFPGPTIETASGKALIVDWENQLPPRHFLPIDHTLHGAGNDVPESRAVVHLHGGRTPADSDGYPENWIVPDKTQMFFYPCRQEGAHLFYHDHTMGINRLNSYAGLQGMFLVRDEQEAKLGLPGGKYEVPLLICDRILHKDGQLEYPVSEKPGEVWVPEVFGEAILANGKLLPFIDVEPRVYRFRIMNGANGRFFRFSLANKAEFYQIGSDQGLLAAPVPLKRVTMAPGRVRRRADRLQRNGRRERGVDQRQLFDFAIPRRKNDRGRSRKHSRQTARLERLPETSAVKTRRLTLDEKMDDAQRSMGMLLNNAPWHAPVTEKPALNTAESGNS